MHPYELDHIYESLFLNDARFASSLKQLGRRQIPYDHKCDQSPSAPRFSKLRGRLLATGTRKNKNVL